MSRYLIGRSPSCDIVINDQSVSRSHAELVIEGNTVSIRDLGSSNGTFINGSRIEGTHYLNGFDILKVGNSLLPWKNYLAGGNNSHTVIQQKSNFAGNMGSGSILPGPIPNATTSLVLGICSIVFSCLFVGLILGIIGLSLSGSGKRLYQKNPTIYTNYSTLNAGYICSIIGTILGSLYTLYYIIWVIILGTAAASVFNSI